MNMVGSPKYADKMFKLGVDIVGDIPFSIPILLLWMSQKTIGALSPGSRRWSLPSGESMVGEVWQHPWC
jgi:hypothetical protein